MPIFSSKDDQLTVLNILPPAREKGLQRMIENNMMKVLELHFLASEYPTSTGGRIDTLAVDTEGAPVIVEYKRNRNDNVINQSLSYLKWLKVQQPEFFKMLMLDRLGKEVADSIKLDWSHPRIVCVAESYSKFDIDTVEVVPLRIDLFKYRYYEGDIFSMEMASVNERQRERVEACQAMPMETSLGIIQAMKEQNGTAHHIRTLFDDLRELIMGMDEYIIEKPGRRVISYRLSKIFAEILIRKDWLVIDLRPIDYEDPRGMVERIAQDYTVTLNRRITLTDPKDLEYVFGIIEQSYQNVL